MASAKDEMGVWWPAWADQVDEDNPVEAIRIFETQSDRSLRDHQLLEELIGSDLDTNPHAICESHSGESPPSCLECGEHLFDHDPPDDEDLD
jgi:hypothetical protein